MMSTTPPSALSAALGYAVKFGCYRVLQHQPPAEPLKSPEVIERGYWLS
jgi:hypothetical protein